MSKSKVDLSVFKEIMELSDAESLAYVVYGLAGGDLDFIPYKSEWDEDNLDKEFQYKHIEQDGGGEGGSEYCYGVFELKGVVYKAEYSYYSQYGHDYDDILSTLKVVTPVQKMVTVYE